MISDGINLIQQSGQEFVTNFISDLAPLIILFGEELVRQFMSQSQDWGDYIIFAMGPLGVAPALIGAVRLCGSKILRGLVGRGRETRQKSECDLTSATSTDVCEVWDGDSIVRLIGHQTFVEGRLEISRQGANQTPSSANGENSAEPTIDMVLTTDDMIDIRDLPKNPAGKTRKYDPEKGKQIKEKVEPEKPNDGKPHNRPACPNLSLNAIPNDISFKRKLFWVIISILMQIGVLAYGAIVQYKFKWLKDGRMGQFKAYAYPFMAAGTVAVSASMVICSYIVDKSMERKRFVPEPYKDSVVIEWRPFWIQKHGTAGDQLFDSYIIFGSLRKTLEPRDAFVTLHPRKINPHHGEREQLLTTHEFLTLGACILGVAGFFFQVTGLRALHWSIPAAQLGQTLLMALIRAHIRTTMNGDKIRVVRLKHGFELEWLATRRDDLWKRLNERDEKNDWRRAKLEEEGNQVFLHPDLPSRGTGTEEVIDFWGSKFYKKWSVVTGEKVNRLDDTVNERGSFMPSSLKFRDQALNQEAQDATIDRIMELETGSGFSRNGKPTEKEGAQRALNSLRMLLRSNTMWEGTASKYANALVKTMVFTLNVLLPPELYTGASPSRKLGSHGVLKDCGLWHWPLVVQMGEKQVVKITLIRKNTGRWFVVKESMEALLNLWLFTLHEHKRRKSSDQLKVQEAYMRLIGSNSDRVRWEIMKWDMDHCSPVYEGNVESPDEKDSDEKITDYEQLQADIESVVQIDGIGQVMGFQEINMSTKPVAPPATLQHSSSAQAPVQRPPPAQVPTTTPPRDPSKYFRGREVPPLSHPRSDDLNNPIYSTLATRIECTIEELCTQEIFFRFLFALGTHMREDNKIRIRGNTTISAGNTKRTKEETPESTLNTLKFHNTILERIAVEATQSEVCGSLEDAYQCIVPAFSQTAVLPEVGEILRAQITGEFRSLVEKNEWLQACDLYEWLWNDMGSKFPLHSNEDLHVIALYTNFVRKLQCEVGSGSHDGRLTNRLALRAMHMLGKITEKLPEAEEKFKTPDAVTALGFMMRSCKELDALSEKMLTPRAATDSSLWEVLGLTKSHRAAAAEISSETPDAPDDLLQLEVDANFQDILQRRPLHYAAGNPEFPKASLECLFKKTKGVDQRDINHKTPLHMAASSDNRRFLEIIDRNSEPDNEELRKKGDVDFNATDEFKRTPLHYAASGGHHKLAASLIQNGAFVDAEDRQKCTPLHWAAQGGRLDAVKVLIENGANVRALDINGRSPLHAAASNGDTKVAEQLIDKGATLTGVDIEGKSPLDVIVKLAKEELSRDSPDLDKVNGIYKEMMETLLLSKQERAKGWTTLHSAAHRGELDAVEVLLELDLKLNPSQHQSDVSDTSTGLVLVSGVSNASETTPLRIVNQTDYVLETPLHVAARAGHLEVARKLISANYDCNIDMRNRFREDALMVAAKHEKPQIVDLLKEHYLEKKHKEEPEAYDTMDDNTLRLMKRINDPMDLHWAAYHGSLELVEMLLGDLSREGDEHPLYQRQYDNGLNPVHCAALMGHDLVVGHLLEKNVRLVKLEDEHGNTALHYAAAGGRIKVVEALVKGFIEFVDTYPQDKMKTLKDYFNRPNHRKESPLHWAAKGLFNMELENPVLVFKGLKLEDYMWRNLDLATTNWQKTLMDNVSGKYDNDNKGELKGGKSEDKSTRRDFRKWQEEFIKLILRIEGERDVALDQEGRENEVVKYLLDEGAVLNQVDDKGNTPLHMAAKWGRVLIAETLLQNAKENGMRESMIKLVEKKNSLEETPLTLAVEGRHTDLVERFSLVLGYDPVFRQAKNSPWLKRLLEGNRKASISTVGDSGDAGDHTEADSSHGGDDFVDDSIPPSRSNTSNFEP